MYIVPVILMGVVFGLSMDYQVFLVSRMHEEWTMHKNNQRAVRVGVSETAPVIITAASIMLCVFASFAFTSVRIIASMGIGLALSVLTDALIVRLVVIPSFMNMLGNANWWFPGSAQTAIPPQCTQLRLSPVRMPPRISFRLPCSEGGFSVTQRH